MAGTISSGTPEGLPNRCPVCGQLVAVDPSQPPGDAPCPHCGTLLWFSPEGEGTYLREFKDVAPVYDRIMEMIRAHLGLRDQNLRPSTSFSQDVGADSLDVIELVMELEEEFDITIPDDQAEKITTIGELIDYIERFLREKGQ